jgi:hypothetical protein
LCVEEAAGRPKPPGPRFRLVLDDEPETEAPALRAVPTKRSDADLIARYVVAMQRRNLSPRTIEVLSGSLRTYANANRGTFATATRASVETFLDGRDLGPRRR